MKTRKPSFESNKSSVSLLDINVGSILAEKELLSNKTKSFLVIGSSQNDYALVRIYGQAEIIDADYFIPITISTSNAVKKTDPPTSFGYADCSKLIIRRFGKISSYLKRYPDSLIAKLKDEDLANVINCIKNSRIIPRYLKKDFILQY